MFGGCPAGRSQAERFVDFKRLGGYSTSLAWRHDEVMHHCPAETSSKIPLDYPYHILVRPSCVERHATRLCRRSADCVGFKFSRLSQLRRRLRQWHCGCAANANRSNRLDWQESFNQKSLSSSGNVPHSDVRMEQNSQTIFQIAADRAMLEAYQVCAEQRGQGGSLPSHRSVVMG